MRFLTFPLTLLVACAPPATKEAPSAVGGWLVVQTPPTGPLRCWEIHTDSVLNPCSMNGKYARFETDNRDVLISGENVACTLVFDGNWSAAYEALRVSSSNCWQPPSHNALAGAS